MASIFLDDPTSNLRIGGGQWSSVTMDRFFGGSAIWPAFAADENGDTGTYGNLNFVFRGTSVAFFGNTPIANASQSIMVSIDGGQPYKTSYMDPAPPSSRQWYRSPTLSDAMHNITIMNIAGTSIDFIVATAGHSTPLLGQKLVVDDGDSSITYNGNWETNGNTYTSCDNPITGLSYGNSTHQTTTPGASATFQFSGSSAAVYGIFAWQMLGSLSVVYTIDGFSTSKTYNVTPTTPEFQNGVLQRENFLFFSNDSLTPSDHTLTMEVTRAVNQSFALDYIMYSPSFATLATKPNLTAPLISTSLAPTSSVAPTSTLAPISNGSSSKSKPVGAIAGGVIGGILLLLIVLAFLWRKRRSSRSAATSTTPPPQSLAFDPFILPSSTNGVNGSFHESKGSGNRFRADSGSDGLVLQPQRRPPSMSLHKSSPSSTSAFFSSISPSMSASAVAPRSDLSSTQNQEGDNTEFRNRMQRLEELVLELNREIASGGDNTSRVAGLRGRIAELTRQDAEITGGGGRVRASVIGSVAPPAYEPRRD